MRVNSIAERSTRYCNYTSDKFGNDICFVKPAWLTINTGKYEEVVSADSPTKEFPVLIAGDGYIRPITNKEKESIFLSDCIASEAKYKNLIALGCSPQEAREVLPLSTATELAHTAFEDDWKHFMELRFSESTGKVHPNMKELTTKLSEEFRKNDI